MTNLEWNVYLDKVFPKWRKAVDTAVPDCKVLNLGDYFKIDGLPGCYILSEAELESDGKDLELRMKAVLVINSTI